MFWIQQLSSLVGRIRWFQVLNTQIFDIFKKYLKTSELPENAVENIKCFTPPIHPSCATPIWYVNTI